MKYDECPICGHKTHQWFTQPFRKFCNPMDIVPDFYIPYNRCPSCRLVYAPSMYGWGDTEFKKFCYNEKYPMYDADILLEEGNRQKLSLTSIMQHVTPPCKHLDFGGGNGQLARMCRSNGFDSVCYDRFTKYNDETCLNDSYHLVSAIEVLEHTTNLTDVMQILSDCCLQYLYISTGLYDTIDDLPAWYYCNPRVGHINLFCKYTIENLLAKFGFKVLDIKQQHKEQMNIWAIKL